MQLQYELSPDDYAASQSLFLRKRRAVILWFFSIYGALFLLFGLWQLSRGALGSAVVPLLFGALGILYFPVVIPLVAKKSWAKLLILHGPTTFETSSEGIETSNPMTRAFVRWQIVQDVVEGPQMWLVFIGPMHFYMVPKRALTSDEERAQFRAELGSRGATSSAGAPLPTP